MKLGVAAIGIAGPGMENWDQASRLLRTGGAYDPAQPMPPLAPSLLPANERRRTTKLIKLALQCGQNALAQWHGAVRTLPTVFASSGGDLEIVDRILSALCLDDKPVSPTHFHNSVHNAPAGYWSIAAQAEAASTSISAYDASFAAGLLEAATQVVCEETAVLLVAYDMPPPGPLRPFRPLVVPFALALLLSPGEDLRAQLDIEVVQGAADRMADEGFERLRLGNPAARALPLLQQLARREQGLVRLPYLSDRCVAVKVRPC